MLFGMECPCSKLFLSGFHPCSQLNKAGRQPITSSVWVASAPCPGLLPGPGRSGGKAPPPPPPQGYSQAPSGQWPIGVKRTPENASETEQRSAALAPRSPTGPGLGVTPHLHDSGSLCEQTIRNQNAGTKWFNQGNPFLKPSSGQWTPRCARACACVMETPLSEDLRGTHPLPVSELPQHLCQDPSVFLW